MFDCSLKVRDTTLLNGRANACLAAQQGNPNLAASGIGKIIFISDGDCSITACSIEIPQERNNEL